MLHLLIIESCFFCSHVTKNIDIWSKILNLQVKFSVNIWYINYSLAHLIGRSKNGVLETVAQFSCSWVANTFWGSWNFTKVTRLWPKLPFTGSQNLLVTKFCQNGSWVAKSNRNHIQTCQRPVCMCVEAIKQATNKWQINHRFVK